MGCAAPLLLLGALASAPTVSREDLENPPPRVRVAGVKTLSARSRIVYRSAPDRPHLMEAAFAFPERGRSRVFEEARKEAPARARYRIGARVYGIDPPAASSRPLEGEERATALRELALRRAVLFWPHSFEWRRVEGQAHADLGAAGRLVARFADDETGDLPASIASETAAGVEYERFTDIRWGQPGGEPFVRPLRMNLEAGGEVVWEEEVLDHDARAHFVDSFFVPSDRRKKSPRPIGQQVQLHELPARVEQRLELEGDDWPGRWTAALVAAAKAERELAERGRRLNPVLGFELAADGRPVALRLRLAGDGGEGPPPAGWESVPGGLGASLWLAGPSSLGRIHVSLLRQAAERAGRGTGTAYLLVRRAPEPGRAQLVLPLHE